MKQERWKIAVDTGGTFTDCIAINPEGETKLIKVLSNGSLKGRVTSTQKNETIEVRKFWNESHDIFSGYHFHIPKLDFRAVVESSDLKKGTIQLSEGCPEDFSGHIFELTAHEEAPLLACRLATATSLDTSFPPIDLRLGSTKGTNALLEKKGAKCALILTSGFKDLLVIGTQQRPDLFALNVQKDQPIYDNVYEVGGRLDHHGHEIEPLDADQLEKVVDNLVSMNITSVAICLMNAYANPEHENLIEKALISRGIIHVSLSSKVIPMIKVLPRAQTTLVNAYLLPIISQYLGDIVNKLEGQQLLVMSSSGGLAHYKSFHPKDSLLSGPAGGVIGAGKIAEKSGEPRILTLDMGGTSTDVSRYDDGVDYAFECTVGNASIVSPTVSIETVAAGGGSVCKFDGVKLTVGPESAGAHPGPACYGNQGPLSITDINLLLGRVDPDAFGIPVEVEASQRAFDNLFTHHPRELEQGQAHLLEGFRTIANEKMAEAIKKISTAKGYDPKDYALLSFGGAGGQHACGVADLLGMTRIIAPYNAGLLSAYGIGQASIESFSELQLLMKWADASKTIENQIDKLNRSAIGKLLDDGYDEHDIRISYMAIFLRFSGQENSLEVPYDKHTDPIPDFKRLYQKLYGHWIDNRAIELESIKVVAAVEVTNPSLEPNDYDVHEATPQGKAPGIFDGEQQNANIYRWEGLRPGAQLSAPAIVTSENSTFVLDPGWEGFMDNHNTLQVSKQTNHKTRIKTEPESVRLELFTNRLMAVADEMGELLKRTSFSVNIKERLDFSCGILDNEGALIVNAPHIPVHLGSLGVCVRMMVDQLPVAEGDILITNHPGFGGSHLPDITLAAPVFFEGQLIAYVANRAHHAEIGGKRPGSMPPDARNLVEEGVVFHPQHIVKQGIAQWSRIEQLLTESPYPTRALAENLADLRASIAALKSGQDAIHELCSRHGAAVVCDYMQKLKNYTEIKAGEALRQLPSKALTATEELDDGSKINVNILVKDDTAHLDFSGTSPVHPGNLNANLSIVTSAVLYVLRLLIKENIPLNEGIMKVVRIHCPESMINPKFSNIDSECPAVVGGNTEVSQRLVDTLIKAFGLSACSQGTMNNLLFGNSEFGYYETICGGTGAGEGFHGSDAVHQHMTNTMITDPEILEHRYPVLLHEFSVRRGSGGSGKWNGGNGVVRKMSFTDQVEVTLLTQHRKVPPYGMNGGSPGHVGQQSILRKGGSHQDLSGIDECTVKPGDKLIMETPGGGGFGT